MAPAERLPIRWLSFFVCLPGDAQKGSNLPNEKNRCLTEISLLYQALHVFRKTTCKINKVCLTKSIHTSPGKGFSCKTNFPPRGRLIFFVPVASGSGNRSTGPRSFAACHEIPTWQAAAQGRTDRRYNKKTRTIHPRFSCIWFLSVFLSAL